MNRCANKLTIIVLLLMMQTYCSQVAQRSRYTYGRTGAPSRAYSRSSYSVIQPRAYFRRPPQVINRRYNPAYVTTNVQKPVEDAIQDRDKAVLIPRDRNKAVLIPPNGLKNSGELKGH